MMHEIITHSASAETPITLRHQGWRVEVLGLTIGEVEVGSRDDLGFSAYTVESTYPYKRDRWIGWFGSRDAAVGAIAGVQREAIEGMARAHREAVRYEERLAAEAAGDQS